MKFAHLLALLSLTALVSGCETIEEKPGYEEPLVKNKEDEGSKAAPTKTPEAAKTPSAAPFATIRVFFGTDRNIINSNDPNEMFGAQRNSAGITYGICQVSIPRDHRMGMLETPSALKLEFRSDPAKHIILQRVEKKTKREFYADLQTRIRASSGKKAFIFVHGYNVKFADAARRTAQISYDLGFDGAAVFYSWPSHGIPAVFAYTTDEQNVEWSQSNLKLFLEDFFDQSDAQNVYLIAHSMGNRALTRAVSALVADKPSVRERLKEIILTAPDIDAEVFQRDIAPALSASDRPITLYASSNDFALRISKKVHGSPRAGDAGPNLVITKGIETIDATNTDTSFIGHSYYAERLSILADMFYMITEGRRASGRFGLLKIDTKKGPYWIFKK